ncbi:MAG: Ig-like domain-containing protein [Tannerellaceae bacterium]|nr:Ig-like domain-containing protein [Tannerellaceae bacterium]
MKKVRHLFLLLLTATGLFAQERVTTVQGRPYDFGKHEPPKAQFTTLRSGSSFTFDDITFWTGEGSNRAALVVQWNDDRETNAMAWGYQWDGKANGVDMVAAVAKNDPRFFAMTEYTTSGYGSAIGGLGYDRNGDGLFTIKNKKTGETLYPNEDGLFMAASGYNYDDFAVGDPEDFWQSGWYQGYWSYYLKQEDGDWGYSGVGASGRVLSDNCWDGWNYAVDMSTRPFKEVMAAEPEGYTYGTFLFSGDDTKSQVHMADKKGAFAYDIYAAANTNQALPPNLQQATIFGHDLYLVFGDTGAGKGSLVIADAKKLTRKAVIGTVDGKAFAGVSPEKGYLATSQGIVVVNLESQTLGGVVYGTQAEATGRLLHAGDYLFAIRKPDGLRIIDTRTDQIVQTLSGAFTAIAQSRDGTVWAAAGSKLVRINPVSLATEDIPLPVNARMAGSDGRTFLADAKADALYWVNDGYANPTSIYRYEAGKASSLDHPFFSLPDPKGVRFTAIGLDNKTGQLFAGAAKATATNANILYVVDAENGDLLHAYRPNQAPGEVSALLFPDSPPTFESIEAAYTFPLDGAPLSIAVNGIAVDKDDPDCNIRLSVLSKDPSLVTAEILSGQLVISPVANQSGHTQVTVKALSNGKTSKKEVGVTITRALESIAFDSRAKTLKRGSLDTLQVTFTPANATNREVSWKTTDYGVANVSSAGVVTARAVGEAKIIAIAKEGEWTDTCTVTVVDEPLAGIALNKPSTEVYLNRRDTLFVQYTPFDASNKTVTWKADPTGVVQLSSNSDRLIITGVKLGTTTLTATSADGGFTAECQVNVTFNPAAQLTLNTNTVELNVPNSASLTATFLPANASNRDIAWFSANPDIAKVSASGYVTAVAKGETQIIAQSKDNASLVAAATVKVGFVPVTGLVLGETEKTVALPKRIYSLPATVTPSDASDKQVVWTSSDEELATVNQYGSVSLLKPGSVTIAGVTGDGGFTAECRLTIVDTIHVTGISLEEKEAWLKVGGTKYMYNTILPADATLTTYTLAFEKPEVINRSTPTSSYIKALALGDCKVYVTTVDGSFTDSCLIHVVENAQSLSLGIEEKALIVGEKHTLAATVAPANARQEATWTTTDKAVATVDDNGAITALKAGTALIIAASRDNANLKDTCTVTVSDQASTGIVLNETATALWLNESRQLTATVVPANTTNRRVAWKSSDYTVADVNSAGYVSALKAGKAIITATAKDGGAEQSCEITVREVDYTDGVFFINEDWFGHNNSTVNFLSADGAWKYRVFQAENPGHELGCTSPYGAIYGGKFYIVSKQSKDPGSSIRGSRLAVVDAQTMKLGKEFAYFGQGENDPAADGRAFLGVDEHKGYISSSNGIWLYDMDSETITGQLAGTGNTSGSLYLGQMGTMLRVGGRVFAVNQQNGLFVIDAETDAVQTVIAAPKDGTTQRGYGSVVQSKDGNLWLSVATDVSGGGGSAGYMLKLDPWTLDTTRIALPADMKIPNSWYAWTADGFCASAKANKLYWKKDEANWWFAPYTQIVSYDIDLGAFSVVFDAKVYSPDDLWGLYGAGFRVDPKTDDIYAFLLHNGATMENKYRTVKINTQTGAVSGEYPMEDNYWFPALPVFPDNAEPVVSGTLDDLTITEETRIWLGDKATDADSPDAAIVKSILPGYDEGLLSAYVWHDSLVVAPLTRPAADTPTALTLTFNSNGKVASKTITVTVAASSTGIASPTGTEARVRYAAGSLRLTNLDGYACTVITLSGQKRQSYRVTSPEETHPVRLTSGAYLLTAEKPGERKTFKFVVF